jgi:F1F0 ATPase subunit 2
MDEKRMSFLAIHLAAGIGLGLVYFQAIWWNARQFAEGGRLTTTIGLMVGRFILLGGILFLVSLEGALPLLMTALGVLIARFSVMRRVRATS